MDLRDFTAGELRKGHEYSYFLPQFINHAWTMSDAKLQARLESVSLKLGELNSFAKFVPNIGLFIQSYVTKEAVRSSRIEGTKTDIQEAFTDELDINPEHRDDWNETIQYREALNYAISELKNLPLSNRLLKSTHKILLAQVRGKDKSPGEFRRSQNWIGGVSLKDAVFIPPSPEHVAELMSDLEKFLHNQEIDVPHLIKIAIVHYQFETIHPFLDGNGRIGRLLIPLYFVDAKILEEPLLYISDFFEKNKTLYYDLLTFTRQKNDLSSWVQFFLQAVETTADEAVKSLREIMALKERLFTEKLPILGRKYANGQILLNHLFQRPVITSERAAERVGVSFKAANDLVTDFVKLGILKEITGNKRNRLFAFQEYLAILKR